MARPPPLNKMLLKVHPLQLLTLFFTQFPLNLCSKNVNINKYKSSFHVYSSIEKKNKTRNILKRGRGMGESNYELGSNIHGKH
jgi:hypothetical protein